MKRLIYTFALLFVTLSMMAATITGGTVLYLKPNSNWTQSNAWFAMYLCNGSSAATWVKMVSVGDGIYAAVVPSGESHENVIFCRMNSANTTKLDWSNKWNQTSDLTWDGSKNLFTVPGDWWDGATKEWSTYTPTKLKISGDLEQLNISVSNGSATATFEETCKPAIKNITISDGTDYWKIEKSITLNKVAQKVVVKIDISNKTANLTPTYVDYDNLYISGITSSEIKLTNTEGHDFSATTTNVSAGKKTVTIKDKTTGWSMTGSATIKNQASKLTINVDIKEETITISDIYYKVTLNAENGKIEGATTGDYEEGTSLTITATPNAGYEFEKWNNGNTENPRTITVTSAETYTATFSRKDRTFSDPSTLKTDTYGQLSYQLTMPNDRWYWISFPFDVNVEDIVTTGANKNYNDLVFTEYDAQIRAGGGNGWINWKTVGKDIAKETLIANKGYVIGPKTKSGETYKAITVTFPSAKETNTVTDTDTLSTKPTTGNKSQDANWHIIGTGLYHPTTKLGNINYIAVPDTNSASYYKYYYVGEASGFFQTPLNHTFKPFEAFFVQHGGEYSATADNTKSAALAPVARAKAQEQEQIYLINMNEARTVVILNAEGSEGYTAGEDFLEMNLGSRIEMIYSFDGTDALAFNHRATEAQSIALGGYVATAGEQTISLNGYNANVEAVTLIDNFTGETADLLAGDYTFNAEVGSLDGRFTVVFGAQKAGGITTDCYNSTANQIIAYGSANACTVSGLTAGEAIVVYNTMGQLVFATIADSETITLPSLTTGNYLILHNGTTNKVALR